MERLKKWRLVALMLRPEIKSLGKRSRVDVEERRKIRERNRIAN